MKFVKWLIITTATVGVAFIYGASPVHGQITREGGKNTPYFAIKYEKNQASAVVRAMPVAKLTPSKDTAPQKDTALITKMLSYDTKLPYVSYAIKDTKKLDSYIDRQIIETAKKQKITLKTATPQQMAQMALAITAQNIRYDNRMVAYYPEYDRQYDDYISELPLDTLIMRERQGVCRQLAAVYEYVARRIIKTSNSPFLKNVTVDEVISYDYNHAYNVIYNTTYSKNKGVVLEVAFIDPTVTAVIPKSKDWDALNVSHDALFSEFIKSGRYMLSDEDRESLLYKLVEFGQQGELSRVQAYAELMSYYNQQIIRSLNNNSYDIALLATADGVSKVNVQNKSLDTAQNTIVLRYQQNKKLLQELYEFLEKKKTN